MTGTLKRIVKETIWIWYIFIRKTFYLIPVAYRVKTYYTNQYAKNHVIPLLHCSLEGEQFNKYTYLPTLTRIILERKKMIRQFINSKSTYTTKIAYSFF